MAILLLLVTAGLGAQARIDGPGLSLLLKSDKSVVVLDVRTTEEFTAGHLPEAKLLAYDAIDEASASRFIPTKGTTVVVYCRSGRRSSAAARTLKALGYTAVRDLGGLDSWNGPLVKP